MNFAESFARAVTDKKHQALVDERLNAAIDSLSLDHIPVYDSEVSFRTISEVEDEEEVRADVELAKAGK